MMLRISALLCPLLVLTLGTFATASAAGGPAGSGRVFELRTYTASRCVTATGSCAATSSDPLEPCLKSAGCSGRAREGRPSLYRVPGY